MRVLAIKTCNLILDAIYQLCFCRPLDEQIIRCDTGLAGIDQFARYDPSGRPVRIDSAVYNAWAFSSQLQCYRGQMPGCGGHDDFSDRLAAGKKDIVKWFFQQLTAGLSIALDDGNIPRIESLADNFADNAGGAGGVLRRFDDAAIAGRYRTDQGRHRKQAGIVPGGYDQGNAVGFRIDIAGCRKLKPVGSHPARFGPFG